MSEHGAGGAVGSDSAPKIYLFVNGTMGSDLVCVAIAEDGVVLGSHVCSAYGYMRHDLHNSPRGRERCEQHYPHGYEVVMVPEGDAPPEYVFERNAALAPTPEEPTHE